MNIAITGATGFIGKQLCKKIKEDGNEVTALVRNEYKTKELRSLGVKITKCDVTDPVSIKGCLRKCDFLFHLANVSRWWLKDKNQYFDINVIGTQNILEEALESGVQKVVFTSSIAAIRQPPGIFSQENLEHCGEFESEYGKSKYLAEQEVLKLVQDRGLNAVILNPGVVIGPEDFKTFGKMLMDFLNRKLKFRVFDNSFVPIVYINDVVQAHILALKKGKPGEKYIIVGDNVKIIDIFNLLHRITNIPIPKYEIPYLIIKLMACIYEFKSTITGQDPKLALDAVNAMRYGACAYNEKAMRELGIIFTPLEQALINTINWYKENGYVKF